MTFCHRLVAIVASLALAIAQVTPGYALLPTPQVGTMPAGDATNKAANTSFVSSAIANLQAYLVGLLGGKLSHVANAAGVAGWAITSVPLEVDGYASPGDGGRKRMVYDSVNACGAGGHPAADGVMCVNSTVSGQTGSWNIDLSSSDFEPSLALWGSFGSGNSAVDTAALQACINFVGATNARTCRMPGQTYNINTSSITSSVANLKLKGGGKAYTTIACYLPNTNIPATNPCLTFTASYVLDDLGLYYPGAPDTTSTSDKSTFGPLIKAENLPNQQMHRVVLARASVDVDMIGNSGNSHFEDVGFSCFSKCWQIDGALDTITWTRPHGFPFYLTANQSTLFMGSATGWDMGRMDDFRVSNGLYIGKLAFSFHNNAASQTASLGGPLGGIENFDFDTHSGIFISAGTVTCTNCLFTQATAADYAVSSQGGMLDLAAPQFFAGASLSQGEIVVSGTGRVTVNGGSTQLAGNYDMPIFGTYAAGAELTVMGHSITRPGGTSSSPICTTNAMYVRSAGRMTAVGNRISDSGTAGTGGTCTNRLFNVTGDGQDRIIGNVNLGWSNSFPANPSFGVYQFNLRLPSSVR